MFAVPMLNLKKEHEQQVFLNVMAGHKIFIVNESKVELQLKPGQIAGFGAGNFVHKPRSPQGQVTEVDTDTHVLFDFKKSDADVLIGGKLCKLQTVVEQRRIEEPNLKINYHTLVEQVDPSNPKVFNLNRTHDIYYIAAQKPRGDPAPGNPVEGEKMTQANMAAMVPLRHWHACANVALVWSVKWTVKGLMPIKPHICFMKEAMIKPGHGIHL